MAIDVELKTLKQNNTSWPLTFKASNRFPIVANRVFATLEKAQQYVDDTAADASAYQGIILAVVQDTTPKNNGVYYVSAVAMAEGEKGSLVKVGGTETETAANYSAAVELSKTLVVGQLIKVEGEYTDEENDVTYQKGFYIVEGAGVISALATSTGADDEVGALKARVDAAEVDIDALEEAVAAIEIPVKDVMVGDESLVDENGIARIVMPDLTPYEKVADADLVRGRMTAAEEAIEELQGAVEAIVIPDVPVQDVTVDGVSVLGDDGVAKIVMPDLTPYETVEAANAVRGRMDTAENAIKALQTKDGELEAAIATKVENETFTTTVSTINTEIAKKVEAVEGSRLMTDAEGTKLAGIAEGAQVNKIEVVKVNGVALTIADADKSVDVTVPTAPVQGVADGDKILALDGDKLKTTLTLAYVPATESENAVLRLQGINGEVVSSIDATAFVKDGMLADAKLEGPKGDETGEKFLSLTFNTDGGSEEIRLNVSDLIDYYVAGNGLNLNGKTFSVKVDETANKYLQVTTNGIAVSQAFLDKITELDNSVLASAKTYADGLASNYDEAGAAAQALTDAKAYADGLASNYDEAGAAAQALTDAKAYTDDEIAKLSYDEAGAAAQALTDAKAYADGLASNYDESGSAAQALTDAKAYADGLASNYDESGAAAQALTDAKAYADGLASNYDAAGSAATAEQNAKDYADETFVTKEGFNEFEAEYEEKLNGIAAGAEVNVIESININGIDADITGKEATLKVEADDIELGTAIKNGEEEKYAANTKISVVLQGIQDSIRGAIAGGVNSVSAGDTAISVNSADANNPIVSLNVETSTEDTVKAGHIEIVKGNDGVYGMMYYDGDDTVE